MKKRVIRKIIVYVSSIVLVGIICFVFLWYKEIGENGQVKQEEQLVESQSEEELQEAMAVMSQDEMEKLYDEHKQDTAAAESNGEIQQSFTAGDSGNSTSDGADLTEYSSPIDFEGMWKINEDVYAWITVPGTAIDYPILQHDTDNTYYLNYNIDGSYGYPGCIYTENMNSKEFTDNNTIIYGHNMKNGTMFADLHKFGDTAFFEENNKVIIYTPTEEYTYTIFAAYIYDDRHLLYSFNFADTAVYENYLETVLNIRDMNANIRKDVGVTKEDKIITLATCINAQPDKRLLVQAVLEE